VDGIVKSMKKKLLFLYPIFLILILSGCTSTVQNETGGNIQAQEALVEVVNLASQAVDVNLFSNVVLQTLLPNEASSFSEMHDIPLFDDHLSDWQQQVLQAFRTTLVQVPQRISVALSDMQWTDAQNLITEGNTSATDELVKQQGTNLETQIKDLLQTALKESESTWAVLLDRYTIWQAGTQLWGENNLGEISIDPLDHLYTLFIRTYFKELGSQEEQLRTTPVPRGSGSLLEIFQQDAQL